MEVWKEIGSDEDIAKLYANSIVRLEAFGRLGIVAEYNNSYIVAVGSNGEMDFIKLDKDKIKIQVAVILLLGKMRELSEQC